MLNLEILVLGLFKAEYCLRKAIKPSRVKKFSCVYIIASTVKYQVIHCYIEKKISKSRNHFQDSIVSSKK